MSTTTNSEPLMQPAQAADFAACNLAQPGYVQVPHVKHIRVETPVNYVSYKREVTYQTVPCSQEFAKIVHPAAVQDMCPQEAIAEQFVDQGCNCCAGSGSCSKGPFNPNVVIEATPGASPYASAAMYAAPYAGGLSGQNMAMAGYGPKHGVGYGAAAAYGAARAPCAGAGMGYNNVSYASMI